MPKQEPNFELREQAIKLERARHEQMHAILRRLPERGKGETSALRKLALQAHATLCVYDKMENRPPIADLTDSWFVAALTRLSEIADSLEAK